jgi:hypothetical protein
MTDSTIDEVIERLDEIVAWSLEHESRIGYFAAMYRKVTVAVKVAIADGEFEDAERMTRLDVLFANRYIAAVDLHRQNRAPTESWAASFRGCARRRLIIVQQLLTGMNAHINLDLGIAAATVAPGDQLADLQSDFNTINDVLSRLVGSFVDDVEHFSPWIRLLGRIGDRSQGVIIKFSIDRARDEAWELAESLAAAPQDRWPQIIQDRDLVVARFGQFLQNPGTFLPIGLLIIRARETNDVARVISGLADD